MPIGGRNAKNCEHRARDQPTWCGIDAGLAELQRGNDITLTAGDDDEISRAFRKVRSIEPIRGTEGVIGSIAADGRGQRAAEMLKPCTLELGGKSAAIVLEDVDLAAAGHGAL